MSRARNIKPGFFKNDRLAECDPLARILFAGLWCEADRDGRLEDRPKRLKAEYLAYDVCDCDELLNQLAERDFIVRYESEKNKYIQVCEFKKHQNPHVKEGASTIPAPCKPGASTVQVKETPEPTGLIPDSPSLIPDSKKAKTLSADADAIPYTAIVDSYHLALPMLPQVKRLTDTRRRKLKARWFEDSERQSLEYWTRFFTYAAQSDFLTGRDGRWHGCDFEWLIEASNHLKVTEGKYENRGNA